MIVLNEYTYYDLGYLEYLLEIDRIKIGCVCDTVLMKLSLLQAQTPCLLGRVHKVKVS